MANDGHDTRFGLGMIFSHEELKEATNNFDSSKELGRGGFGKVYRGTLHGKEVAVKKLFKDNPGLVEKFDNEVRILSRIRHPNLVTLHGSTDSSSHELLLVYDFVPNGTVAEHLHGERSALTLDLRIQIAVETAKAIAYIHALDPPVIHRDIKTSNILLDNGFHAKVADFGICRLFPLDATHVSTLPQGTMGYRDPEYDRNGRLTKKSDVYSFGVVLLELMTGMQAVDVHRGPDNIYLAEMALRLREITGNRLKKLVVSKLDYHSDTDARRMINLVAELTYKCLLPEAKMRPTMLETLKALKDIKHKRYKIDDKNVNDAQAYTFSYKELSQATEAFHDSRHLSKRIYIGNFDGLTVAVKALKKKFGDVNDISQLRHDNIATLYGSTDPDSKDRFLVYEYVPNGSVKHHLHGPDPELLLQQKERIVLDWALRIRIAVETAEALSHLHSLEPPVIYQLITTNNILLDDNYHVKLSGLNPERGNNYVLDYSPGLSEVMWPTTKYDVYSFGVVLLELISGNGVEDMPLAWWGSKMIQKNKLDAFVDKTIDYHSNLETKKMVTSVAELACRCVLPKKHMRPTMAEVLSTLKQIKDGTPVSN